MILSITIKMYILPIYIHSIKINVKELSENHVIIHCIYINDTNNVLYVKKLETTKGNNQMCLYFPCVHFFENF